MNSKANPPGFGADFSAYVPGFDFLQKLAQGDPQALYANWIAPTLDPKVLDQRITELKAVLFWLDQNSAVLKATLQALEVQKMTLAALRSMGGMSGMSSGPMPAAQPNAEGRSASSSAPGSGGPSMASPQAAAGADPAAPPFMADAMQYWGALTQQFQTIAAQALQDVAARGAAAAAPSPASTPTATGTGGPQSPATGTTEAQSTAAPPSHPSTTPRKAARPATPASKPSRGTQP